MTTITVPPDFEFIGECLIPQDTTVVAIRELEAAVVGAFRQHDKDLRSEVERVNSQIGWLIGLVALVGATILLWPKRR